MAVLLHSRHISNVTQLLTYFLEMNAIKRPIRNELSTVIIKKTLLDGDIHSKNISAKRFDVKAVSLSQQYSIFFWGKHRKLPVKCKIKCNDLGELTAEPYIAKKPTPIKLSRLTTDFTMNIDCKCMKLEGNKFSSKGEIKPMLTKKKLKSQTEAPNALTKYLQKKDQCNNIFRGDTETCSKYVDKKHCVPNLEKKDECTKVFRGTEDVCNKKNMSPTKSEDCTLNSEVKQNKAKQIMNNIISKLRSMKLMKPSGFISVDLINEAINVMKVKFAKNNIHLTCVREKLESIEMPNFEKSLVRKFGERSKSQQFPTQQTSVEKPSLNKEKKRKSFISSGIGRGLTSGDRPRTSFAAKIFGNIMNRNKALNMKLKKTEENKALVKREDSPKSYGDTVTSRKNLKLKKPTTYKPKSRQGVRIGKRKRRFSFSKIPIQPNVKGSVIFLDETTPPLDDPCKILSVNFFKTDDVALEDINIEGDTALGQFTAIKAKSNGLIKNSEVKKIPIKAKIYQGYSEATPEFGNEKYESDFNSETKKNQFSDSEVLVNMRTKKFDSIQRKEATCCRNFSAEPIIRKKKISKLDKNITSFVTTVFPQEKLTKSLSKFKKNNGIQEKFGFISLNEDYKDIPTNVPVGEQDGQINEAKEKDMSTTSIGTDFYRKISDIPDFKSEESISRTIETGERKEKYRLTNNLKSFKGGFKTGITVSPGLTRPVTEKTAHLDILKTKPFAPISNMWKNSTASTGRLISTKKSKKKKAIKSTNNLTLLDSKGHNLQQMRWKSTTSCKSKRLYDAETSQTQNKGGKTNSPHSSLTNWDYEGASPPDVARKYATLECPLEKPIGSPITSDDLKKGPPVKRPSSAAAINRSNYNECKNRMRRRKCGYRSSKKNIGKGC